LTVGLPEALVARANGFFVLFNLSGFSSASIDLRILSGSTWLTSGFLSLLGCADAPPTELIQRLINQAGGAGFSHHLQALQTRSSRTRKQKLQLW
jgi:hypothetical protein